MTYPTDIDILDINEFGEKNFVSLLYRIFEETTHRNKDWFDPNKKWSLIHQYQNYRWTFAMSRSQLVAFSAIQDFGFGHRVLTRTYYMPEFRKNTLDINMKYTQDEITPAMKMCAKQIEILKKSESSLAFISMEYPSRRSSLQIFRDKLNKHYSNLWVVPDNMYLTCPNRNNFSCWQNICYTELKPGGFNDWDNITVDEWKQRYGNSRKKSY